MNETGSAGAYGHRARIGYTSVAFVTEVLPVEFYRMAPDGVILSLITMEQVSLTSTELNQIYEKSVQAARTLADADVDIIVLGGRPVILTRGLDGAYALMDELSAEFGKPVISDATAQIEAFRALGSKKILTVHPFGSEEDSRHDERIRELGLEPVGSFGGGATLAQLPLVPTGAALEWAREAVAKFPGADTLLFPCPHWPVVGAIAALEAELGLTVLTNLQATLWKALRLCGITDPIPGYGRLLEDL
ncbi:MAG: maleate cis-trans isomerase family protein [Alphaproteobacteria bacterium]